MQTYQDGICVDYSYNYGRRMSPTAKEIVAFLKEAMEQNRTVGADDLLGGNFSSPVNNGVSCLAALPSQLYELIPEPYKWLAENNAVEDIYATCMDPEDNVFDMKRFESLCEERIQTMKKEQRAAGGSAEPQDHDRNKQSPRGRRIIIGDHYWTVISRTKNPLTHPFEPPAPFSDRLSNLKSNRRLKVSRVLATSDSMPRSAWSVGKVHKKKAHHQTALASQNRSTGGRFSDMGRLLKPVLGDATIEGVGYRQAYQSVKEVKKSRRKKVMIDLTLPKVGTRRKGGRKNEKRKKSRHRIAFDSRARMEKFKVVPTPKDPARNIEGSTALQLLQQLNDAQMIGSIQWNHTMPSNSDYASINPDDHESVQLVIQQGVKPTKSVLHEGLTYEQDRDVKLVSRQAVKQHLASFALCDLLGPQKRWSDMNITDIRNYLRQKVSATEK